MRACLAWAEDCGTGDLLTAIIDPGNEPSLRLSRRLGFAERTVATYQDGTIVLLERPRRSQ